MDIDEIIEFIEESKKEEVPDNIEEALKEVKIISEELNKMYSNPKKTEKVTKEEEIELEERLENDLALEVKEKLFFKKEFNPEITNTSINDSFTSMTGEEKKVLLEILKSTEKVSTLTEDKYDFKQVRKVLPIDEWLNDSYYVPFTKYIYPYWKEYIIDIFKGQEGNNFELPYNEVVVGGCFSGDTTIFNTVTGKDTKFKDLAEMYKNGEEILIDVLNPKTGEIEKIYPKDLNIRYHNARVLEITLSNLYSYKCTLDHKHMLPDGTFVRADELKVGDELYTPYNYPPYNKLTGNYEIKSIRELEELEDVYCMETPYNNFLLAGGVVVSNSIGIGKSTLATVLVLRMIYVISCFENIQTFYGLMPGSPLYICIISVNREVAEATLYGDLLNKIDMTPYFTEKFPRNKRINSLISFPNDLTVIFGSNVNSVIGKNVICFAADEMGFRNGDLENTNKFYNYLLARNKSRFIYDGGKDGSLAILMSSATTSTSIVEQRKREALTNPKITARDPSLWEVKSQAYSKDRFPLFTGSLSTEPCIIEGYDRLRKILREENINIDENLFKTPENKLDEYRKIFEMRENLPDYISKAIIEVPLELKKDFEGNLIDSMMNLAGVAVSPSGRLFTSKRLYAEALDESIYSPFKTNKLTLSTGDNITIGDYMKTYVRSEIENPDIPRFIHIDGSFAGDRGNREADHSGVTMCHIYGVKVLPSGARLPLIKIDFQLEIESPKAPNQTSLEKVLDIVFSLHNIGYNIKGGSVTYDGFQSQYAIQLLEKNGFKSYVLSVDRTDAPYLDLINMFYEKRIKLKNHEKSQKELFELIHFRDRGKVDHPSDGSKDIIDSVCGSVQAAIRSDYFQNKYLDVVESSYIDADEFLRKQEEARIKTLMKNKDDSDLFMENCFARFLGGRI